MQSECKMKGHKSSISNQNSSGTKKTTTTKKPCNPRKHNSSCKSEAATELSHDIVRTTLDHTPTTLSVNAIRSKFPDHISDEHLRQHFSKFEKDILRVVILRSKKGKYGLITFSSSDIAETARTEFRDQRLLGCLTHLSYYEYRTTPKDQICSEVASCVPSKTDSCATASVGVEQSGTKNLHQASELEPAVTSGDSLSGNNTLCVEGIHCKLPDEIGDDELMKHFCAFGNDIISASIVRNPQTKLSAGYGIITFKSPEIVKKAQKKYNGTHLCRKYQLRATLKNLASSTKSTILVAKVGEDTEVLSSDDRRLSESNLAALRKKRESQKTCDDSASSSSFAVSDNKDVKSLKDKEIPSFAGLVVENLSDIVEESELKALVSSCGANVSSCVILRSPGPVAINTCVANITLVDSSQLGDVIKQLNEKEVYGCKLRVYATDKKPLLHIEERKISSALFEFITKNSHSQIKMFEEKGGVFKYQEPKRCALISAPGENVTTEFLLYVFNRYTEKAFDFKPSQWNQLTLNADKYTPSLLNRAGSKFRAEVDAHVIPQIDKHEILFVGTCEGVARTSSWLMDQLTREFGIERYRINQLMLIKVIFNFF